MDARELLTDLFGRIPESVHAAVDGLGVADLTQTVVAGTNPIGWLVWHLARVQDAQVADAWDVEQVWVTDGWASRFGLAADAHDTGYGHRPADVARVQPESVGALLAYFEAVAERTSELIGAVTADDLDRVVDDGWDPPVTLGVRLISIADDDIQHAGQAAYLRGLLSRGTR